MDVIDFNKAKFWRLSKELDLILNGYKSASNDKPREILLQMSEILKEMYPWFHGNEEDRI